MDGYLTNQTNCDTRVISREQPDTTERETKMWAVKREGIVCKWCFSEDEATEYAKRHGGTVEFISQPE